MHQIILIFGVMSIELDFSPNDTCVDETSMTSKDRDLWFLKIEIYDF